MSIKLNRRHQTALFVRVSDKAGTRAIERIGRLVESLNGAQIKTDVYTVTDGGEVLSGLVTDAPKSEYKNRISSPDLRAAADAAGYTQTLVHQTNEKFNNKVEAPPAPVVVAEPAPEVPEWITVDWSALPKGTTVLVFNA